MRSRRAALVLLLLGSAIASILVFLLRTERAELLLARRLATRRAAEQILAQAPGCAVDPALSARELLALLLQDGDDPGCPQDLRVGRLLAQHPDARLGDWMETLLREGTGPQRLRVRVSLGLVLRSRGLPERVRRELLDGDLGPVGRERVLSAVAELLGPYGLEELIAAGTVPRFDAGAGLVAERFAHGDWGARGALVLAIHRELERPTLLTTPTQLVLTLRAQRLADAALAGLGLSSTLLEAELARDAAGFPPQRVDDATLRWFSERGTTCAAPASATCLRALAAWLEHPERDEPERLLREAAPPSPPALPEPWAAWLAGLSADPALLQEAAVWVSAGGPEAGRRVLGLAASAGHAYGWGPWMGGQRGDPADALRYGGATPGASALAARALAAAAGVEVQALRWGEDTIFLQSTTERAFLGPCGPGGSTPPPGFLPEQATVLTDEALLDLARLEQLSAALAWGQVPRALALRGQLTRPGAWPDAPALLGSLAACEGQPTPGLGARDLPFAAAWAEACGQPAAAEALARQAGRPLAALLAEVAATRLRQSQPPWTCGDPARVPPPLSGLERPPAAPPPAPAPAPGRAGR